MENALTFDRVAKTVEMDPVAARAFFEARLDRDVGCTHDSQECPLCMLVVYASNIVVERSIVVDVSDGGMNGFIKVDSVKYIPLQNLIPFFAHEVDQSDRPLRRVTGEGAIKCLDYAIERMNAK